MVTNEICPRCHEELPIDAPEGLCPECLFRQSVAPYARLVTEEETAHYDSGFVPPAPAELARYFPHLEILELIGRGGMGAVYRARQPALDRLVAVKVLPSEVARDPAFAERFSREARSLARFNHPNIVTVHDFGETGGLYHITMEYVAGKNLREILQDGTLSETEMLRIVVQVCDALQYAHEAGVVHRDVKPENILLDARGQVKIADFGLAKLVGIAPAHVSLTGSRDVMGTVYYVAPEQLLRNADVDHRADIYSLGVVFYEMLTGELPVGRFAPPGQRAPVDGRLDPIVLRALESKPEHRYQDAAEFKRDVEAVLAGHEVSAAARGDWPSIRFTIPNVTRSCSWADGEMYRDAKTLFLDFSVVSPSGSASVQKEVRIPISEIRRIVFDAPTWRGLPRWMNAWRKAEIFIKVFNPADFPELPVGRYGYVWGQLQIRRDDSEAAQQLVDGIRGSPLLARPTPRPSSARPVAEREDVARQLRGPAWGLLLTAIAALAWTVGPAIVAAGRLDRVEDLAFNRLVIVVASVLALVAVPPLIAGAVQMLRRRSYLFCVAAAMVALLPWSPAWLAGLPVGIWALVVLNRPEVMAAFLQNRGGTVPVLAVDPEPPGPVAGKVRSLWRSFVGYFVMTIPAKPPANSDVASPQ